MEKEVDIERIKKLRLLMLEDDSISEIRIDEMRDLRKLRSLLAVCNKSINFKQLGQEMDKDYRTIKKYIYGYEKTKKRKKQSKLHIYEEEIKSALGKEKFKNIRTLWKYMKENYGLKCSESTFRSYIQGQKSFSKYFEKSSKSSTYVDGHIKKYVKDNSEAYEVAYFIPIIVYLDIFKINVIIFTLWIPNLNIMFNKIYEKDFNCEIENYMISDFFSTAFENINGIPREINISVLSEDSMIEMITKNHLYDIETNINLDLFHYLYVKSNIEKLCDNKYVKKITKAYNVKVNKNNNINGINKLSDFDYFIHYFYLLYSNLLKLEYKYIDKIEMQLSENRHSNDYYNNKLYEYLEMKKYVRKYLDDIYEESCLNNFLHDCKFNKIFIKEKLSEKLKMLEINGVRFYVENNKIKLKGNLITDWYTIPEEDLNKKKMLVKCIKNADKYSVFIKFTDKKNDSFINI